MSIVGGALWYATIARRRSDAVLAGAIVGIGIAAMDAATFLRGAGTLPERAL